MDADARGYAFQALTETVIGSAYRVANELGAGFLEKVYENALAHELRKSGLAVVQQARLEFRYDGAVVGEYFADLLVEQRLVLELKHAKAIDNSHLAQCLNYLKATNLELGLIINFGTPRVQIKRVVLSQPRP